MSFITDFADQAVLLPLAAWMALALGASRWWRGLAGWLLGVGGVLGGMALLKYVCFACAVPLAFTGVHSPSGHTAASAAIYGGGLLLLCGRLPPAALAGWPLAVAALFAVTRIAVHAHDVAEVLVGGAVGLLGVAMMLAIAGPRPPLRSLRVAAVAAVLMVGLHGMRLNAEATIHHSPLFSWLPLPSVCRA